MVVRPGICAAILMFANPAGAQSPQDRMFPDPATCYARVYTAQHLSQHPEQRVTTMRLSPDAQTDDPRLVLQVQVVMRGTSGGDFEGFGYCENQGGELYCAMEGDAGGFSISPARDGAILVAVSSLGLSFENEAGFVSLTKDKGDDRSFLLRPSPCR